MASVHAEVRDAMVAAAVDLESASVWRFALAPFGDVWMCAWMRMHDVPMDVHIDVCSAPFRMHDHSSRARRAVLL